MTVENKIISAQAEAYNLGWLYADKGIVLHLLERHLHELKAQGASLSDPDRKELVKAIKTVKHDRYQLPQHESPQPKLDQGYGEPWHGNPI